MSTSIPVTTLSNLRKNLVPPSLQDLLYIQQGSEHDRDSAITLGGLLGTQVIQSFLNDRENWRTFTIDENNSIQLGDYQRNVIIVPSAKDQSVTLDHFPSNGIIIYAPDWDSASESTAVTIGDSYGARPIIKGGVGIFYCFGGSIIARSLISSANDSLAQLKELTVDNLIVKSDVALRYGSNAAFDIDIEPRVVNETTYYDLIITKPGDSKKIKIPGDSLKVVFLGINPGFIDFDDGLKNCWAEFDGDDFKTLKAERIEVSNSISLPDEVIGGNHLKNEAIGGNHLEKDFVFPEQPKFPRKIYKTVVVTESTEFDVDPDYNGTIFSTASGLIITQKMHFSDADSRFQAGDTYRIYNETPNDINVTDWTTGSIFTGIIAWTFKDFYYNGSGWELA